MPQLGIPLENQWARWPGVTYQLPVQCWVGPHHSRDHRRRACRHRRADRARRRQDAARPHRCAAVREPAGADAVGRADAIRNAGRAYRSAMIAELWNTVASGQKTTLEQRARCRLAVVYAPTAREAMDLTCRHGGSTLQAREPPRRMLARPAHRRPDRHARARMVPDRRQGISGDGPRPAAPLAEAYSDCYRNPIDNHGIAAMINSEMTSAPM